MSQDTPGWSPSGPPGPGGPPYPGAQSSGPQSSGPQYPGAQYSGAPGAQYPGAQYPGAQPSAAPYPGAQYPGGAQYPAPGGHPAAPVSSDDGTWALMAYISTFFAGFVGPLVVYFSKRDQSPFVRYHAVQSLNLMLTGTIYSLGLLVLATVAGAVTHGVGFLLFFLIWLALGVVDTVYVIVGAVAAHRGQPAPFPRWLALSLVR